MNGNYHIGVVKTLIEANLMPRIVCGSSAGSFIGAMICTKKLEDINMVNFNIKTIGGCENWAFQCEKIGLFRLFGQTPKYNLYERCRLRN